MTDKPVVLPVDTEAAYLMLERFETIRAPTLIGDALRDAIAREFAADLAKHRISSQALVAWQPIETAPKMRGVMLWADTSTPDFRNWKMGTGYFSTAHDAWIWEGEIVRKWAHPPTHWQPLPSPPVELTPSTEGE
jgi:hypothetical protein